MLMLEAALLNDAALPVFIWTVALPMVSPRLESALALLAMTKPPVTVKPPRMLVLEKFPRVREPAPFFTTAVELEPDASGEVVVIAPVPAKVRVEPATPELIPRDR